jgi:hypothetical protein
LETRGLMAHTYLGWLTQRSLRWQPPGSKNDRFTLRAFTVATCGRQFRVFRVHVKLSLPIFGLALPSFFCAAAQKGCRRRGMRPLLPIVGTPFTIVCSTR